MRLAPPEPALQRTKNAIVGTTLGIVVNPKLKRPLLAVGDGDDVYILRLDVEGWPLEGSGYYDSGGHGDDYGVAERVTGFPRVHTPSGVKTKGAGYGTCLYTALALGAYQTSERHVKLKMRTKEPGISSQEGTRSSEADAWWQRAKNLALAGEETSEEEEEEEGRDLHNDVTASEINSIVSLDEGESINYVRSLEVDVTIEKTETADYLTYDKVWKSDLVVSEIVYDSSPEWPRRNLWKYIMDETADVELYDTDPNLILALDVRGLTVEAINLLELLALRAGKTEEDVDSLRLRWEQNLDPGMPIRQLRLGYKPNARAVERALDVAAEARADTAWDALSELP